MATIQDVARTAGVGVGTVSRVLNGSPSVSAPTRQRVQQVIEELHYHPRKHARSLSLGRTHTLGIVVPFMTEMSAVERIKGVLQTCGGSGYDVVLFDIETSEQRDDVLNRVPRGGAVDGLLVISLPLLGCLGDDLAAGSIPAVLVDCRHPRLPHIVIDDREGGRMATDALLTLGHRRIAFVGHEPDRRFGFAASSRRQQGYEDALLAAGVAPRPEYVRDGPHTQQAARRITDDLLALSNPPTAVFAASDRLALGVVEAARAAGRNVPADLSVIGFDDVEVAAYADLSSVRQPLRVSGARGAELLLEAMRSGDREIRSETLDLELVLRGSTGPAPP